MVAQAVFQIMLLSPFTPVQDVPIPLHWHFYEYGHFGPVGKKEVRKAMKDLGAVEDPSAPVVVARFDGHADTLFLLNPKLDGAVHVTTFGFRGQLLDATLAINKKEKKKNIYALTKQLVSVLYGSRNLD